MHAKVKKTETKRSTHTHTHSNSVDRQTHPLSLTHTHTHTPERPNPYIVRRSKMDKKEGTYERTLAFFMETGSNVKVISLDRYRRDRHSRRPPRQYRRRKPPPPRPREEDRNEFQRQNRIDSYASNFPFVNGSPKRSCTMGRKSTHRKQRSNE